MIVNGSRNRTNVSGEAHLDNAIIQRLPQHRLQTTTSVTDGIRQFDGFLLRDLLNLVLAEGDMVTAKALNNYRIDIPISDFYDYDL